MVDLLDIQAEDSLLEVGTRRGYQTAVMAELEHHVWSIDIIEEFVEIAQSRMVVLDNENVTLRAGDGSRGWANAAPFDKIIVAAAADEPPARLLEQLNPGGRLVIPLRRRGSSANHADCKGHRWLDGEAPSYPCEVLTFGISPSSARPERSKTAMASSLVPSYNWCGANGNWKRRRRPDGRRSYASPENAAGARHTECNWHEDHRIGVLYTRSRWWWNGGLDLPVAEFRDLLTELTVQTEAGIAVTPGLVIAQGDSVMVEATSHAVLANGRVYHNRYIFLFHFTGDLIREVREYSDSAHVNATFDLGN